MSDKKASIIAPAVMAKPDTPIDLSDLGGKRLDVPVRTKSASQIDLSDLGGKTIHGPMVAEKEAKPVDLSSLYGESGGLVLSPPTESNSEKTNAIAVLDAASKG